MRARDLIEIQKCKIKVQEIEIERLQAQIQDQTIQITRLVQMHRGKTALVDKLIKDVILKLDEEDDEEVEYSEGGI